MEEDGNTNFFHKVANGRKRKNLISSVRVEGEEVMDFQAIPNEAIHFYSSLYKKDGGRRPVVENLFDNSLYLVLADWLERPFGEEEVKEAIFGMDGSKSPSLDGFTMFFYQVCWDIIKDDLMNVTGEFF